MKLDELVKKYRHFEAGAQPAYDRELKDCLAESFISNPSVLDNPRTGRLFSINDVDDCQAYLENELADGGERIPEGFDRNKLNEIEQARMEVDDADRSFVLARRKAINVGRKPPEGPTLNQLECQAVFDVCQIERDWLEDHIKQLKQQQAKEEAEERRQRMRKDGISGSGKISYETGKGHIDSQLVAPLNGNGVICILDPISPYNGMAIVDYREHIVTAYRLAVAALEQKREERYKELRKDWILSGAEPREEPIRSHKRLRASFPPWPKGLVNHLVEKGLVAKQEFEPKNPAHKKKPPFKKKFAQAKK